MVENLDRVDLRDLGLCQSILDVLGYDGVMLRKSDHHHPLVIDVLREGTSPYGTLGRRRLGVPLYNGKNPICFIIVTLAAGEKTSSASSPIFWSNSSSTSFS